MLKSTTILLLALMFMARLPATQSGRLAVSACASPVRTADGVPPELFKYHEQGVAALAKGDPNPATTAWTLGLRQAEQTKCTPAIALFNWDLGTLYSVYGPADKAVAHLTIAKGLFTQPEEEMALSECLSTLGALLSQTARFAEAEPILIRALALREKLNLKKETGTALADMGTVYVRTGRVLEGRKLFVRSLEIFRALGEPTDIVTCLTNLGGADATLDRYDDALKSFREAAAIAEKAGYTKGVVASLTGVGGVYGEQGEHQSALPEYKNALALAEKGDSVDDTAMCLFNMGITYHGLSSVDQALDYFARALKLSDRPGLEYLHAQALKALGISYRQVGQLDRARTYLEQALAIARSGSNRIEIAFLLIDLGGIYTDLGDVERAERCFAEGGADALAGGRPSDVAVAANNLALALARRGYVRRAQDMLLTLAGELERSGNKILQSQVLSNLASVQSLAGQRSEATASARRSLELGAGGMKLTRAKTLALLGYLYEDAGDTAHAQSSFDESIKLYESASEQLSDPTEIGALQDSAPPFLFAYLAKLKLKQGSPAAALAAAERGRQQGLVRLLLRDRTAVSRALSAADAQAWRVAIDRQRAAAKAVIAAGKRALRTAATGGGGTTLAAARQLQEQADAAVSSLRTKYSAQYPEFGRLMGHDAPTAATLQSVAAKRPGVLFIECAVTDSETVLMVMSAKGGTKGFVIPKGLSYWTDSVSKWRLSITRRDLVAEPKLALEMYQALFSGPGISELLDAPSITRIVAAMDGPLLEAPLAALRNGRGQRLAERFAISSCFSIASLEWPSTGRQSTKTLLCAVDPSGPNGEKFVASRLLEDARDAAPPLRFAREEGRHAAAMFKGSVGYAGPLAKESRIKAEMPKFAILHFATHGFLNDRDGLQSWLLLSPDATAAGDDGRLEAQEILSLPLSAKLAVLSACESGRGQYRRGDGLVGLAWAFYAAGCRSVLASQWPVDDEATGKLSETFYKHILAGESKDVALKNAIAQVRTDPAWKQPYYWAAFTIIGDTSPIPRALLSGTR